MILVKAMVSAPMHLQRDSQDLSTSTQLTKGPTGYVSQTRAGRLKFLGIEPVWFLPTILYNNAWQAVKLDRSLKTRTWRIP